MKTKVTILVLALATVFACNTKKENKKPESPVVKENTETRTDRTERFFTS